MARYADRLVPWLKYADQPRRSLFSWSRTVGHVPWLPGTSNLPTFVLSRCTLFLDGLAPRYQWPSLRKRCGPNVYPRKSKRSVRAFFTEVLFSLSESPSLVITAFVHARASVARPRLRMTKSSA